MNRPRTVLVTGSTGATGRLLVQQLLDRGHRVRAVARDPAHLPDAARNHPHLQAIPGTILGFPEGELVGHVQGCDALVSCLGHRLSFRGMFGPPHRLVTDSLKRLHAAVHALRAERRVRLLLMNTAGVPQPGDDPVSPWERIVLGILRTLLPPHADNEQAAAFLGTGIGTADPFVDWVAVRPDSLFDADEVGEYDVVPSPVRSALFKPGRTSRIQVAHLLAELAGDDELFARWKGRFPVIYDHASLDA